MGQVLISLLTKRSDCEFSNFKDFNVNQLNEVSSKTVILDFSHPSSLEKLLLDNPKIALISGTTNLNKRHMDLVLDYALTAPIMLASNFSFGVHKLSSQIRSFLLENENIEKCNITEVHHTEKKDSPSGTAKTLATQISETRPDIDINFTSLRKHSVFGLHSVSFLTPNQEVIFHHQAFNREIFAAGAIEAAFWLREQQNGLYPLDNYFKKNL